MSSQGCPFSGRYRSKLRRSYKANREHLRTMPQGSLSSRQRRLSRRCGLTWQDINLEEQCLTIKRSIRYDGIKHKNIIGPTKRKKVRIVDFGDTLTEILKAARKEQLKNRMQYGELYHRNYYKEVHVKNRVYYEYYHLDGTQEVPADYKEISFVCLRPDGSLELPSTLSIVCRSVSKKLEGFEDFHFHQLRHTYTSNLLSNGAAPKDVQELLGHHIQNFSATYLPSSAARTT